LECPAISRLAPQSEVTAKCYVTRAALRALEKLSYDREVIRGYYNTLKEAVRTKGIY